MKLPASRNEQLCEGEDESTQFRGDGPKQGGVVFGSPGVAEVKSTVLEVTLDLKEADAVVKLSLDRVVLVGGQAQPRRSRCEGE